MIEKNTRSYKLYVVVGMIFYILAGALPLFFARLIADLLPCKPLYYESQIISCSPRVVEAVILLTAVPIVLGTASLLYGVIRTRG